jgi:predicted TPR repeat methyltransferase
MTPSFEQARQLFLDGIARFEAGRFDDAQSKFEASLELLPDRVATLTNLAATRIQLGRADAALPLLAQALTQAPDDAPALLQRGVALAALGRHDEALHAFQQTIALLPETAAAWLWQGHSLRRLERHDEALASYDKALALEPAQAPAWSARGSILADQKRLAEAAAAFEQAITCGADPQVNGFLLASLRGETPAAVPRLYVQGLFDDYADSFDTHLVQVLNYQAHRTLVERLRAQHGGRFESALDLGCGTGLCGPLLKDFVDRVDGVDLAGLMLEKARSLGLYDRLDQADLAEHLLATQRRYELVLAADVFPYVGDLAQVFAGVRRVLDPGGWFCFSVEAGHGGQGLALGTSQRYSHSEAYLRSLALDHGFSVAGVFSAPIREDQRQPIIGLYLYLTLPGNSSFTSSAT